MVESMWKNMKLRYKSSVCVRARLRACDHFLFTHAQKHTPVRKGITDGIPTVLTNM
jgi:hypothetical protein